MRRLKHIAVELAITFILMPAVAVAAVAAIWLFVMSINAALAQEPAPSGPLCGPTADIAAALTEAGEVPSIELTTDIGSTVVVFAGDAVPTWSIIEIDQDGQRACLKGFGVGIRVFQQRPAGAGAGVERST